jgi:hypothetical protein
MATRGPVLAQPGDHAEIDDVALSDVGQSLTRASHKCEFS